MYFGVKYLETRRGLSSSLVGVDGHFRRVRDLRLLDLGLTQVSVSGRSGRLSWKEDRGSRCVGSTRVVVHLALGERVVRGRFHSPFCAGPDHTRGVVDPTGGTTEGCIVEFLQG